MTAEIPPIHKRITGFNKLIFCFHETMIIEATVAANVAIIQGTNISVGFCARNDALTAIIETGIKVKPEACKHKNMICALDATALLGFNSCRLCIVFNPNGVAALSSPNKFAEKFITIC